MKPIRDIPKEKIKLCPIPVFVYLQVAEDLHHWAQHDAEQLATVRFNLDWVAQLPVRLGAAATLASDRGELFAKAHGDRAESNAARVIRDQAYVH